MFVCYCYPTKESDLIKEVEKYNSPEEFAKHQKAGSKCGTCGMTKKFLREFFKKHKEVIDPEVINPS